MKIHQIRNATILVDMGTIRLLVDPMLSPKGALPPLRLFRMRGRNPSVGLPENAHELLESATHCIITHCQKGHFDHLDGAARKWLSEKQLPVFCTPRDAGYLSTQGLNIRELQRNDKSLQPFLGGTIQTMPCRHGRGLVGKFMEHGVGYSIKIPDQPNLYLTGDTILTDEVETFVRKDSPDVIVAPAGGARFDIGSEIIMNADDVITLATLSSGAVFANHLEAISHCPVTRAKVLLKARDSNMGNRIFAPADGAMISFESS